MALKRLFEQTENSTPANTKRIAFGAASVSTENMKLLDAGKYLDAQNSNKIDINIGAWNMQTTLNILVPHTIPDILKIKNICVMIRNDAGTEVRKLELNDSGLFAGWIGYIDTTNIRLQIIASSLYNSASFSNTLISRGRIYIELVD